MCMTANLVANVGFESNSTEWAEVTRPSMSALPKNGHSIQAAACLLGASRALTPKEQRYSIIS